MNAKVDYTLLDRWRHSHAWWARKRLERSSGSGAGAGERTATSPRGERGDGAGRVVHMPLAD